MVSLSEIFPGVENGDIEAYLERSGTQLDMIIKNILSILDTEEGSISVITGAMRSGKSNVFHSLKQEVIDEKGIKYACFKPGIDTRDGAKIVSRNHPEGIAAISVQKADDILVHLAGSCQSMDEVIQELSKYKIVFIDEIQFFDGNIIKVLEILRYAGVHVICAGLNMNYKAEPFSLRSLTNDLRYQMAERFLRVLGLENEYRRLNIGDVLAIADAVHVLNALSENDGRGVFATHTMMTKDVDVNGEIIPGDKQYEPVAASNHPYVRKLVLEAISRVLGL